VCVQQRPVRDEKAERGASTLAADQMTKPQASTERLRLSRRQSWGTYITGSLRDGPRTTCYLASRERRDSILFQPEALVVRRIFMGASFRPHLARCILSTPQGMKRPIYCPGAIIIAATECFAKTRTPCRVGLWGGSGVSGG
jgi:hypothetical protein